MTLKCFVEGLAIVVGYILSFVVILVGGVALLDQAINGNRWAQAVLWLILAGVICALGYTAGLVICH